MLLSSSSHVSSITAELVLATVGYMSATVEVIVLEMMYDWKW